MLVQHLRHPLERIDVRPGFWGLEWSCPSPWEVTEGIINVRNIHIVLRYQCTQHQRIQYKENLTREMCLF